jgi:hypothetical protein
METDYPSSSGVPPVIDMSATPKTPLTPTPTPEITTEAVPVPRTQEEVEAIAKTLAGECYNNELEDKRKVVEVILNRVSDGRFGKDIITVVTAKSQFLGYWNPSREISANDYEITEQALSDWFANDCEPLSDWLYFSAGPGHKNVFRKQF